MEISEFIDKFADAIEIDDTSAITAETEFLTLNEWDSLSYLSVIALIDEEFDVQIENAEFKQLKTVQDLFDKATK